MADGGSIGAVATLKKAKKALETRTGKFTVRRKVGPTNFDLHRDAYLLILNGSPAEGLEALRSLGHDLDMEEAANMALVWGFATYELASQKVDNESKKRRREQLRMIADVVRETTDQTKRLVRLYEIADGYWAIRAHLSDSDAARVCRALARSVDPSFAKVDPLEVMNALRRVKGPPALAAAFAKLAGWGGRNGQAITKQAIIAAASRKRPQLRRSSS